jgi:probable rRNA maturation factor
MQIVTNFGVSNTTMANTQFTSADRPFRFTNKTQLKNFVDEIFVKEKQGLESLVYVFCSDAFLLNINNTFLQHDYYTDIISFNLSEQPKQLIGEIYISIDRVKDNAVQLKTSYSNEMLRVIFHGALHLCGYKDKTKADIAMMRSKEDYYLARYLKTIKA